MSGASTARLSFDEFERACRAYLASRDAASATTCDADELSWLGYAKGWRWLAPLSEGEPFRATACLERSYSLLAPTIDAHRDQERQQYHDPTVQELQDMQDVDQASAEPSSSASLICLGQSIHWSPIWQLPILYLHATANSQPLDLAALQRYAILHSTGSLLPHLTSQPIHPISFADHPRDQLPAFYLHPCNTNSALTPLLPPNTLDTTPQDYIAAFVSLCASAVHMRPS